MFSSKCQNVYEKTFIYNTTYTNNFDQNVPTNTHPQTSLLHPFFLDLNPPLLKVILHPQVVTHRISQVTKNILQRGGSFF